MRDPVPTEALPGAYSVENDATTHLCPLCHSGNPLHSRNPIVFFPTRGIDLNPLLGESGNQPLGFSYCCKRCLATSDSGWEERR